MLGYRSLALILLLLLLAPACQEAAPPPQETPTATARPTPTPIEQSPHWGAWATSPHADTYDLGKGPNTYCARCHAPRNWDPQAVIDPPPNCVSCKFSFESQPRVAAGNPLVPEAAWRDIGCDICHRTTAGDLDAAIAWWDQAAGAYVPVADATALCGRCHADTETIKHYRHLGSDAHASFQCTGCHDPHSVRTDCADAGCHATMNTNNHFDGPVPTPADDLHPDGGNGVCGGTECHAQATAVAAADASMHNPAHAVVACVACHDASGLEVGPMEEGGLWMTFRTTELLGRTTTKPYQSHAITLEVDCARCHYEDNPWGLIVVE